MCPLCNELPESIYHILYHCKLVKTIWSDLSSKLLDLHPCPITDEEKAFGIINKKPPPGILARNWLTYTIRKCILEMEREAHYDNINIMQRAKRKIQSSIESELDQKVFIYAADGKLEKIEKFFAHNEIICKRIDEYTFSIRKLFK